jgi:hypothetical protein
MTALLVALQIVDKILDIHIERLKHMTPEQATDYWALFEKRMAFWEGLVDRVRDGKD